MLQKAIIDATGPVLRADFIPEPVRKTAAPAVVDDPALATADFPDVARYVQARLVAGTDNLDAETQATVDRILLLAVLEHVSHNVTKAAEILGISRSTLRSRLASLGLAVARTAAVAETDSDN